MADSDNGKAAPGPGGGPQVNVRWLDARTLEVRYDSRARIFLQKARHDDTDVKYVAETAPRSNQ